MGLLAETVMSMSGAQMTMSEVTFPLSSVLTPLLLYFSTQDSSAPGSRQPPEAPVLPTSLCKEKTPCSL